MKKMTQFSKHFKGFIKPFPRLSRAANAAYLLGFIILVVGGAAALTVHNKPTPITTSPTSSTDGNNCLLSNSGCPDSNKPSTPTSTQPAQTTTPSTPATTTTPKPDSSAPVTCQTEDIPYTSTTQYLANEYNTYSYDEGGFNGSKMVCSDGTSEVITPPDNKVHYVGAIDKSAQDNAAYNQIVSFCRSHNPSGGEITTCINAGEVQYNVYASQSSTAAEAYINSLQ